MRIEDGDRLVGVARVPELNGGELADEDLSSAGAPGTATGDDRPAREPN